MYLTNNVDYMLWLNWFNNMEEKKSFDRHYVRINKRFFAILNNEQPYYWSHYCNNNILAALDESYNYCWIFHYFFLWTINILNQIKENLERKKENSLMPSRCSIKDPERPNELKFKLWWRSTQYFKSKK